MGVEIMPQGNDKILPSVSFVVASYNAQKYIEKCLLSVKKQTYPQDKIEILLIDGGSDDKTLEIAGHFPVKIINNPYRIAEFAKSIGIQNAKGDYIVILDTDNEIAQEDWLLRNILPLEKDSSLMGMDSVFMIKKDDFLVNRYCTFLGLEDPLVRYMANLPYNADIKICQGYSVYQIKTGRFPIFGSNGFIWRKKIFEQVDSFMPRYDEAEFCTKAVEVGFKNVGFVREVGIYHHHLENICQFVGKRMRRGKEFMSRKLMSEDSHKAETGVWLDRYSKWEILKSVFLCGSFIYPLYESIKGCLKDRDIAWILHPLLCFVSILSYEIIFLRFAVFGWIKINSRST